MDNREAILDAISDRLRHESLFAEIFSIIDCVGHTLKHLKEGCHESPHRYQEFHRRIQPRHPPATGGGGRHHPVELPHLDQLQRPDLAPLRRATAPWSRMSENSRHITALLMEKIPEYFPRDKLAFFDETGGVGVEFSQLKFDHLDLHRLGPGPVAP